MLFMAAFLLLGSAIFAGTWGPEEDRMDWASAQARCESKGMRLPTRSELLAVFRSGLAKSWMHDYYWTGEEASPGNAYDVHVIRGEVYNFVKYGSSYVRCIL